jgi:glutathione S-transferase
MIVYGSSLSPFARKVLFFAGEKGLAVEHRPLPPQSRDPEFRAISPLGKIPAFADGDYRLSDSSAICHYLERKYPTPSLFPTRAEEIGRMIWLEEFSDTVLSPATLELFVEIILKPKQRNQETDRAAVEAMLGTTLPPLLDHLQSQISGPFLVGGALSLADISLAGPFVTLKLVGHPLDAARWPRLAQYVDGLLARPAAAIRDPKPAA